VVCATCIAAIEDHVREPSRPSGDGQSVLLKQCQELVTALLNCSNRLIYVIHLEADFAEDGIICGTED
jgi:hypothetical protein